MSSGNPALSLDEVFLGPQVIEPPPVRRALFLFLLSLAAALHIATAGWGYLYNETEGQYAGAAREMIESGQWLIPTNDGIPRTQKPPVVYWLIALSLKAFGMTTAAVRLMLGPPGTSWRGTQRACAAGDGSSPPGRLPDRVRR